MSLIEWDDSFNTGLESVDEEHREMVRLINDFHDLMREGGPREQVLDLLGLVYSGIKMHFANEEDIMRRLGYADYRAHKADHDRLLTEIDDITEDYERDKYYNRHFALAERLKSWFETHFFDMDRKLHRIELEEAAKADFLLP